jgi:Holliday junction resolvase RusA-like endonuclease
VARVHITLYGEAASKANSRKLVTIDDRPSFIKSDKARAFAADVLRQIPPSARVRMEGPVRVSMVIYYASERPDLDESLVLDLLQDQWGKAPQLRGAARGARPLLQHGVYRNDRQVREKHIYHRIDRKTPRVEVLVEPMPAPAGAKEE